MKIYKTTVKKIKKFVIDYNSERDEYEAIMNNEKCTITKTENFADKAGRVIVIIWYEEEVD